VTAEKPRAKRAPRITPKQRQLIAEYLVDLNGAHAAVRAGYSKRSAKEIASQTLRMPHIAAAVEEEMAARERRTRITGDRVLREYARIAFADIRAYAEWGPASLTLRPAKDVSEDDSAAIAEVSSVAGKAGAIPRLKLHDKKRALDAIARHLGLFDTRHAGDPKARQHEANRVREMLIQRIAAIGEKE